jgi:hypothetical protein
MVFRVNNEVKRCADEGDLGSMCRQSRSWRYQGLRAGRMELESQLDCCCKAEIRGGCPSRVKIDVVLGYRDRRSQASIANGQQSTRGTSKIGHEMDKVNFRLERTGNAEGKSGLRAQSHRQLQHCRPRRETGTGTCRTEGTWACGRDDTGGKDDPGQFRSRLVWTLDSTQCVAGQWWVT